MKILLDTHCWLWWFLSEERLGDEAKKRIADPDNVIYFSAASAWEISIKVGLGKLELPMEPERYIPRRLADQGMVPLAVELEHTLRLHRLPHLHRDPFDRLLVAQAQAERLTLATADPQILAYDVDVLWAAREPRPKGKRRS